ncbi:MAG: hypothetical protein VYE61_02390 [Pseudomonadota bacterium]|nr:hypothetical protein [Pseudomonadota bacterium]MEC9292075.1 hypothetical protein [Pseudomonadota bacterium]
MPQKTIYFAHPMCDYGTEREAKIIKFLEAEGYHVVNPADHQQAYDDWLESPAFTGERMKFWTNMAMSCDECAFIAFADDLNAEGVPHGYHGFRDSTGFEFGTSPCHRIGAGVWKEVDTIFDAGKPVFFVQDSTNSIFLMGVAADDWATANGFTKLTVDETRALLRASGTYKK